MGNRISASIVLFALITTEFRKVSRVRISTQISQKRRGKKDTENEYDFIAVQLLSAQSERPSR